MSGEHESGLARWKGRNEKKDALRAKIWSRLEGGGAAVGSPWSRIPNYVGADKAAARLAELPFWKQANIVKSNPDKPQIPVRLRALQEGKLVYTPVPELVRDFPFILLDPDVLAKRGVPFEVAATSQGAMDVGKRVQFEEMKPLDIVVVGCVAVTRAGGRTGKGGGFADLELGIFRELNLVQANTPIVTTVHPIQVVDDDLLIMLSHDTPLDWIVTTEETIETRTAYEKPTTMDWEAVQPDQYRNIPFLGELRDSLGTGRN
jgi:5-formyltetrahydrofolate cyclo-ligase